MLEIRGIGERERFSFSREGGEGSRGRLRGERIGVVVVGGEVVCRCGGSGWWLRVLFRHFPYRAQIGWRLRRGSSGGWSCVGVGVSGIGVRSRQLGGGAGSAHRVPFGVRGCGSSGAGGVVGGVVGVRVGTHAIMCEHT